MPNRLIKETIRTSKRINSLSDFEFRAWTYLIDVVAWRGTAEVLCSYADKGRMIVVEGRLQMRDWTDKNGNKRRSAEVQADSIYFADSRAGNSTPAKDATEGTAGGFAEVSEDDGELPF